MPSVVSERMIEESVASILEAESGALEISLPQEIDPRLEPSLTGSIEDDMNQVHQSLAASRARKRHFDHVVAGRLSGLKRAGKY